MVVGTIDADWTFTSVSADIEAVLGIRPDELIGRSIRSVVATDEDVERLLAAAAHVSDDGSVALPIVTRSRTNSAKDVSFVLTALAGSSRRGFIITEDPRHIDDARAVRLSTLERHLWNIAAEVDASGILQFVGIGPNPVRFPQLRTLTTRQWEILSRLIAASACPRSPKISSSARARCAITSRSSSSGSVSIRSRNSWLCSTTRTVRPPEGTVCPFERRRARASVTHVSQAGSGSWDNTRFRLVADRLLAPVAVLASTRRSSTSILRRPRSWRPPPRSWSDKPSCDSCTRRIATESGAISAT